MTSCTRRRPEEVDDDRILEPQLEEDHENAEFDADPILQRTRQDDHDGWLPGSLLI